MRDGVRARPFGRDLPLPLPDELPLMLAVRDIRRSKLRFGLLAGAVGLLVFLLLFLNSISNQLVQSLIGALDNSTADVLVIADDAQGTLSASRLDPAVVESVAGVADVGEAVGIGLFSATTEVAGEEQEISVWGVPVGGPGFPDQLIEGRFPEAADELVVDVEARPLGFTVGETVTLSPSGLDLTVVGVVDNASYFITATAYLGLDGWTEAYAEQFPGAPDAPLAAVGVAVDDSAEVATLASRIESTVPGVDALTPSELAAMTPGIDSLTQSFGLILGITFLVVVLLVGFFFLILTVQKLRPFTVLRAVGAPTALLGRAVALQIVIVVASGVAIGTLGLWLVSLASTAEFTIRFDPSPIAVVTLALLASSLIAGWFSIRRIARQDPADAAFGGGR
jgi:putative ABC transport system permease protein